MLALCCTNLSGPVYFGKRFKTNGAFFKNVKILFKKFSSRGERFGFDISHGGYGDAKEVLY